jgi:hypothetical protein
MKTFIITDGGVTQTASTLTDAAEICERWYDSMQANGKMPSVPPPDLDSSSLSALNASIAAWELGISQQSGKKVSKLSVSIMQV